MVCYCSEGGAGGGEREPRVRHGGEVRGLGVPVLRQRPLQHGRRARPRQPRPPRGGGLAARLLVVSVQECVRISGLMNQENQDRNISFKSLSSVAILLHLRKQIANV